MESTNLFDRTDHEFDERVREIRLPNSNDPNHKNHSIRITNRISSALVIKSSSKSWDLAGKASSIFSYDGSSWTRTIACPDSSSSEDGCGPAGRDGLPGVSGLNGLNGKNGKCDCKSSSIITISGSLPTTAMVAVPSWARTAIVTVVGGGGGGGGTSRIMGSNAGSGGGSGYAVTETLPVSGGFISVVVGQGGNGSTSTDGGPTTVTYTGSLPFVVYAPGGHAGAGIPIGIASTASDGQYGGGAGDGTPLPTGFGTGFVNGKPAITGVSGGAGGGYLPGQGGVSLVSREVVIYAGGGGGSAPGPIAGTGGNGGGYILPTPSTQLNGLPGTYGGGGGGAGLYIGPAPPPTGVAGNGGDGYASVTFIC